MDHVFIPNPVSKEDTSYFIDRKNTSLLSVSNDSIEDFFIKEEDIDINYTNYEELHNKNNEAILDHLNKIKINLGDQRKQLDDS